MEEAVLLMRCCWRCLGSCVCWLCQAGDGGNSGEITRKKSCERKLGEHTGITQRGGRFVEVPASGVRCQFVSA
eukprot:6176527-Pleurochrysis_carterae.AAC.3